ncbi:MAG TPA: exopolysaccharide biosynthesis polyprenyl glycosylphosphotransferase, partial [Stenotrophomonas sp.]
RFLAGLILMAISPLMLVLAAAVKLSSPGPVFYRQERMSWNNKTFWMLKFRSMPVDAEQGTGAVWAKAGECRATRVGAFLRKTSLDELPQFLNVLKGDMSIVGPRPERPVFVHKFKQEIPAYMKKHMVKAGITGWAQVNGWRGSTDLCKRIECDLFYIENWSLWFDIKIVFLTLFKGFVHRNAY